MDRLKGTHRPYSIFWDMKDGPLSSSVPFDFGFHRIFLFDVNGMNGLAVSVDWFHVGEGNGWDE